MKSFHHLHKIKLIKWVDDKVNHLSIKHENISIEVEGQKTQDKNNIPIDHLLVSNEKTTSVPHEQLWSIGGSWILPGNNYKIQHNGYEYR